MPKKKRSELQAGIFVLVALAILLGVVFWLGASSIFYSPTSRAVFYAKNIGGPLGLAPDYAVQINDVKVGRIASITIDTANQRTLYVVEFDKKGLAVYADGLAKVSAGLLGEGFLVITSTGSPAKGLADESHPILIAGGLGEVMDNFNVISKNLKKISNTMVNELNAKIEGSLLAKIKAMAGDLLAASKKISEITANVAPETDAKKAGTILANIKATSKRLVNISSKIDSYIQKDVHQLLVQVRSIATAILKTANNLDVSSGRIKKLIVGNSDNLDEMIDNMVAVSANLEAASKEIRRNPWRLLYKPDEKKIRSTNIYDATTAFCEASTQMNIVVTKLKALRQLDEKDPAAAKQVTEVRKQLLDAFKSFKKVEEMLWKEAAK